MSKQETPRARFKRELDRVLEWAREQADEHATREGTPAKTWDRVLLIEQPQTEGQTVEAKSLRSPEDYEERFAQILEEGRSDWINLETRGLYCGALVVVVETGWRYPVGSYPPEHIHVMACGPACVTGFVDLTPT